MEVSDLGFRMLLDSGFNAGEVASIYRSEGLKIWDLGCGVYFGLKNWDRGNQDFFHDLPNHSHSLECGVVLPYILENVEICLGQATGMIVLAGGRL